MPHLFVNRPRLHALTSGSHELQAQFRWETINAVVYNIGGIVFVAGSVLSLPRFESYGDLGAWTFIFGSLLYLVVNGHNLLEVLRSLRTRTDPPLAGRLELIAAVAYLTGSALFIIGRLLFLSHVGMFMVGAWCFVLGSLLFVLGACINVLQITRVDSIVTLQLMNVTAVSFVVGSVLFTITSVPYLWGIENAPDRVTIYDFLGWQYLVGSVLFLQGGLFNYWRAYVVMKSTIDSQASARPAPGGLICG